MISESEGLSSLKSDKGNNRFIPQPKRLKKDLCIVLSWLVRTLHWDTGSAPILKIKIWQYNFTTIFLLKTMKIVILSSDI